MFEPLALDLSLNQPAMFFEERPGDSLVADHAHRNIDRVGRIG